MFHPTIGQHANRSLSNTATPELGMIPQGVRVKAGLHIEKVHKISQADTVAFNMFIMIHETVDIIAEMKQSGLLIF